MPTLEEEFDSKFDWNDLSDFEPERIKAFMKSYILSLMKDVKFEHRMPAPADSNNEMDVGHVIGWNQYHDGQQAKIAQALKEKGIL